MRPSTLAIAFGAGRALIGVGLLAAPRPITTAWVGDAGPAAQVLGRSLGARDLVIGAGLVHAVTHDRDPGPWLAGGVLADAVDTAATLAAGGRIPPNGRWSTAALGGGAALLGAWLARTTD